MGDMRWRSWLRCCGGPFPNDVIGIYHLPNPSGHTVAHGSTQPLIKTSTKIFLEGKGGRTLAHGLTQSLMEMSTRNISWRVKAAAL
jgi:hypothetical protein